MADVTHAQFEPLLGSLFRVDLSGSTSVTFELIRADLLPPQPKSPRPPFALGFRGPGEPRLPQGVYPLNHPELGTLGVFLVPVGESRGAREYEAIFN